MVDFPADLAFRINTTPPTQVVLTFATNRTDIVCLFYGPDSPALVTLDSTNTNTIYTSTTTTQVAFQLKSRDGSVNYAAGETQSGQNPTTIIYTFDIGGTSNTVTATVSTTGASPQTQVSTKAVDAVLSSGHVASAHKHKPKKSR